MKSKKFLIYLLSCVVLGMLFGSPIGAMALQIATETATFIPPSSTPTQITNSCPIGTPAGWGTYTPSSLWDQTCSQCSIITTPTATPTQIIWNGTGTPPTGCSPVTVTPGTGTPFYCTYPTSTPAVIPTSTVDYSVHTVGCHHVQADCVENNNHKMTQTFTRSGWVASTNWTMQYFNYIPNQVIYYRISGLSGMQVKNLYENKTSVFTVTTNRKGSSSLQLATATTTYINQSPVDWYNRSNNISGTIEGSFVAGVTADQWEYDYRTVTFLYAPVSGYGTGYYLNGTVTLEISTDPFSEATATPSPTTTPYFDVGYCSSVAPTISEFGFDLFRPDGEINCNMGWDEWEVGGNVFPAVQICLQPSDFGVIRMFDRDYEVGPLALVSAVAMIWRFLRTV